MLTPFSPPAKTEGLGTYRCLVGTYLGQINTKRNVYICFYSAVKVELLRNQPIIALLMILTLLHSFKESHPYCIRYKKSSFIDIVYDFIKTKDFILITIGSSAIFPQ